MKRRSSSLLAVLLLAGFLAGGVAAPTLHRVHHAQEQRAAQEQAPRCTHGAHDAPVAEEGAAPSALERCWVCTRHVLSTAPPPVEASAALRHEATRSAVALALYASPLKGKSVIRGPPRS